MCIGQFCSQKLHKNGYKITYKKAGGGNLNYRDQTKDRKRAGDILTDMSKIMQGSKKRKKAKNKSSDTPAKKAQRKSGITF